MTFAAIPTLEPRTETEAYSTLLQLADGRTGRIPPELLVRHVLSVTPHAGWPVQRAALEAVLRRLGGARQDELIVASAPAAGLGTYATRRKGSSDRPYTTLLEAIDPLRASCDCRDFVRNSLGLCKHVLTILGHGTALRAKAGKARSRPQRVARLTWDPVRPLIGHGDWMERVRLTLPDGPVPDAALGLRGHFRRDKDGALALKTLRADDPERRVELASVLLEAAAHRRDLAMDPALAALLRHENERWAPLLKGQPGSAEVRQALRSLKRSLYPYQREGMHRFLSSGRLLIADDMGLGKTAQAIAASHVLFSLGRVERGLLIVPATLKDQWLREWRLFTDVPLAIVDGPPSARAAAYRATRRGFLVTNYEQVLRDLDLIHRWKADFIVLDEAQRIKNWATKTAAYVKALRPAYRLVLTGTPMENRLEELASILDWVDDTALEPKWRLNPWHAEYADGKREVIGARHLDTLRARLSSCLVRRVRSEVLTQLPSRTDTVVPVAITEAQTEAHDSLNPAIARLAMQAKRRPLTQAEFLRLMSYLTTQRIIANGMAQLQFEEVWPGLAGRVRPDEATLAELATPKLGHLREILAQIVVQQDRKVVVFSQWRRMLTLAHWAVKDLLEGAGLRAAFFTGQEAPRRRTQNIVDFHDDPATAVLFATDAGGVGLNLQRAASCCVNLDLPWNPAVLEQRIGRIYRIGQTLPIDVYNLVTEASIEARIAGLVADKKALFTGLFDGETNEVHFERSASFLSRLERMMEPARAPEPPADETPEEQGSAEQEVDALVAAADEARELTPAPAEVAPEAPVPPAAAEAPGARVAQPRDVRGLLSGLSVRRREDGGLAIEAPPEAAGDLAALFEGIGRLLREATGRQ